MTARAGRGMSPLLMATDLVGALPELAKLAGVDTRTLCSVPSASLQSGDVLSAADWARRRASDVQGVVLLQGTDTLEETAYLLDLHWDRPEPLVVTGAMRPPEQPGADGPANLLSAAVVAITPESRGRGVLVVMNDQIHAASRVRKTDSIDPKAFSSGQFGVVGRVHEGRATYGGCSSQWPALIPPEDGARRPRVALLETHLGDDGELLRLVVASRYDGVVISAFGVGHVSAGMALAISEAVKHCPVVLATRTGDGPLLSHTYDFPGSEVDLLARGIIPAGWLDARKARILLWSLLATDATPECVRETIVTRGRSPAGPPPLDAEAVPETRIAQLGGAS